MKIREILELTQSMNIAAIAKEHLSIGEKRVRAILKDLDCRNQAGKKGWTYAGNQPEVLEQSIYEFAAPTKPKAIKNSDNASNSKSKVSNISNSKDDSKINNKNNIVSNSNVNIKAEIQSLING